MHSKRQSRFTGIGGPLGSPNDNGQGMFDDMSIIVRFGGAKHVHAMKDVPRENKKADAYFNKIYQEHIYDLLSLATILLRSRADAEDVVAGVFEKIWKAKDGLFGINDIKSFLRTSVRNGALNLLRSKKAASAREEEWARLVDESPETIGVTDLRTKYTNSLHQEIGKLPPKCRQVFELAFYEGLDNHTIAKMLRISKNTVKAQKVKATRLLKLAKLTRDLLLQITPFALLLGHH